MASRATARHFALDERLFQVLDTQRIWDENVWTKAVHRVAAEGISPEQAVDEAIAHIKQILVE